MYLVGRKLLILEYVVGMLIVKAKRKDVIGKEKKERGRRER